MASYIITWKCNLNCAHCYSESTDQALLDELTAEESFRLMAELSQWGIGLLIIDGAEPLLVTAGEPGKYQRAKLTINWQNSPVLAKLRHRDSLKGDCGDCKDKLTCSGCRGRAFEETGDIMSADPGCWVANNPPGNKFQLLNNYSKATIYLITWLYDEAKFHFAQ